MDKDEFRLLGYAEDQLEEAAQRYAKDDWFKADCLMAMLDLIERAEYEFYGDSYLD
ncbi:hypothetical protein VME0621_03876 [Vibrio mediterranei]|uniref:hypothetical protein n=1 Tax=Vibrio mediterranei TaxID=689 RepID=UPI0007F3DC27|nr:hypothetical protein [Vibrio mediterranei]SBO11740.1 hypothetical protein VME0621_03876 [Vibrio mediterranei]